MPMPLITILAGLANVLLGVGLYAYATEGEGHHAPTALIPAYVGLVFVALGAAAYKPTLRKHVMHAAAALALLLALSTFVMGAPKLIQYATGHLPATTPVRPLAWGGQVAMSVILAAYEALCVRSFMLAARARRAAAAITPSAA